MKLGDLLHLKPDVIEGYGATMTGDKPLPCRVIYIHPQGRYYTVEFRSPVTGETWREARWP